MLKEFALCMSTCIDKLHTTYLKPFIFFKSVYGLLDGAWGRSQKGFPSITVSKLDCFFGHRSD